MTIVCDDTGSGIPDEILSDIFDSHTTTKGDGHGNGLFLIHETVTRYHGDIQIETEQDEGTSITVTIPL